MKDRLNKAPLTAMQRAIARQQAVAEEPPGTTQRSPFYEPVLVGYEHLLDVVWMIQKKDMEGTKLEVGDVAIFGRDARQKHERIAPDLGKAAHKQTAPRSRWKHPKILPCPRRVEGR